MFRHGCFGWYVLESIGKLKKSLSSPFTRVSISKTEALEDKSNFENHPLSVSVSVRTE